MVVPADHCVVIGLSIDEDVDVVAPCVRFAELDARVPRDVH